MDKIKTKIAWTDYTWNIATGCDKVSDGCKYCYMMREGDRWNKDRNGNVVRTQPGTFNSPLKIADPSLIFASSFTDFFHPAIDSYRDEAWKIIKDCPQHTFQILTKRPERIADHLPADWGYGYHNVWLGTTIENDNSKHRLITLSNLKTTSSKFKIFVSYEPAIGYLDMAYDDVLTSYAFEQLDWLIVGGESGNGTIAEDPKTKWKYRKCNLVWIEYIIKQCRKYHIPVFVKQMGTYLAKEMKLKARHGDDVSEWPEYYQKQMFPLKDKGWENQLYLVLKKEQIKMMKI